MWESVETGREWVESWLPKVVSKWAFNTQKTSEHNIDIQGIRCEVEGEGVGVSWRERVWVSVGGRGCGCELEGEDVGVSWRERVCV